MRGEAMFTRAGPDALLWTETGVLQLAGWRGAAAQRYRIDGIAGPHAALRFDDRRLFARLDLSGGACAMVHDCPPDRYEGALRVQGASAWTLCWRIAGPRKDQTIRTAFWRVTR